MAGSYLPLAALLLSTATAATLLMATSAVPVAAGAADKYTGARMVIIRAPGTRAVDVSAGGAALNKWQQQQRRRRHLVEDEVAPEFGSLLLGAENGGHISNEAENKDRAVCLPSGECAKPGGSYSRGCTYPERCSH